MEGASFEHRFFICSYVMEVVLPSPSAVAASLSFLTTLYPGVVVANTFFKTGNACGHVSATRESILSPFLRRSISSSTFPDGM